MKYRFYLAADRRQDEIWDYTLDEWGEEQADAYIIGLHQTIEKAADRKIRWRRLVHSKLKEVYFFRYQHHFVFFRVLSNDVLGIISILHESMDLPARLFEDSREQ